MGTSLKSRDVVLMDTPDVVVQVETLAQATIMKASVLNTDVIAHTVSVYRVNDGDEAITTNQIISNAIVAAGQTYVLPLNGQVLFEGQSLQANADANSVINIAISIATVV